MQHLKWEEAEIETDVLTYIGTSPLKGDDGIFLSRVLSKHYLIIKRIFDITSSLLLLSVIWPLIVLIAIGIKIDSKGPVFFRHNRVGQYGKPISINKFRTMMQGAEDMIKGFTPEQMVAWQKSYKLENDPRVTRLGRFLRRSSLDELPQLIDIIRGKLSVVGPRPIIEDELEKYSENKDKLLSVKPGLTGYWQAYARSECSYERRMEMELFYVDHANLLWDWKIIWGTIDRVIKRKGAL